jgi:FkbM family methyltransferase
VGFVCVECKDYFLIKNNIKMNVILFDIGCGTGQRAEDWALNNKNAHVFCFDAQLEMIEEAKKHADVVKSKTKTDRVHVIYAAVTCDATNTGGSNSVSLHKLNDKSSASLLRISEGNVKRWLYPPGRVYFKHIDTINVPAIRMEKFITDRRLPLINFVRIETQGTALDVLKSFGKKIDIVMEFAIKVHTIPFDIYEGQTNIDELIDFMMINGFSVYKRQSWSRDQEAILWFINKKAQPKLLLHLDAPEI